MSHSFNILDFLEQKPELFISVQEKGWLPILESKFDKLLEAKKTPDQVSQEISKTLDELGQTEILINKLTASKEKEQKAKTQDWLSLNSQHFRLTKIKNKKINNRVEDPKLIQEIEQELSTDANFEVTNIVSKQEKSSPYPPFITSTLQQTASNLLGMTPKATMQMAQKLYEGIVVNGEQMALITYMRTDSVHLSQEAINDSRSFIKSNYPKFLTSKPRIYKSAKSSQEAHEAIRPTNCLLNPKQIYKKLPNLQMWKLYNLIWVRTITSQMIDQITEKIVFTLKNKKGTEFQGTSSSVINMGWKILNPVKEQKLNQSQKNILNSFLMNKWLEQIEEVV